MQTLAGILWAFVRLGHQPSQANLMLTSRWTAQYLTQPQQVDPSAITWCLTCSICMADIGVLVLKSVECIWAPQCHLRVYAEATAVHYLCAVWNRARISGKAAWHGAEDQLQAAGTDCRCLIKLRFDRPLLHRIWKMERMLACR